MNYFFAGFIYSLWIVLVISSGWNKMHSSLHNILIGIAEVGLLAAVHWVPFWLIFLRR